MSASLDRTFAVGDGPLSADDVLAAASGAAPITLTAVARERILAAHELVERLTLSRDVYGRTTGVGANRDVRIEDPGHTHAMRLLRSHASGVGELLDADVMRTALIVRLNQLARGGSGTHVGLADALVEAINAGALPAAHSVGAIGTGDITVFAEVGLAFAGEGAWLDGGLPPAPLTVVDALALMSTNAATLALALMAWGDARRLLRASIAAAALGFRVVDGNPEAFSEAVCRARPLPGPAVVARSMRDLLGDSYAPPARIQDPFGFRCVPQVLGALNDVLDQLGRVLEVEINAAPENPVVSLVDQNILHHGNFHITHTALALDVSRLALAQASGLSSSRVAILMEPAWTGLEPFLADGRPGSSGLMIAEYVAADAAATLRASAVPATINSVDLSRGVEEHASFAWQGAWQMRRAVAAYRPMIAIELMAAARALRQQGQHPGGALDDVVELVEELTGTATEDRSLSTAIEALSGRLDDVAALVALAPAPED